MESIRCKDMPKENIRVANQEAFVIGFAAKETRIRISSKVGKGRKIRKEVKMARVEKVGKIRSHSVILRGREQ